ncbi:MAG: hypothetical protein R3C04_10520 [Hyphomonas sp.]
MSRYAALIIAALISVGGAVFWKTGPAAQSTAILAALVTLLGLYDLVQKRHSLWRNYPLLSRVRWLAEELRPFFRSYIVESETEGRPFNQGRPRDDLSRQGRDLG